MKLFEDVLQKVIGDDLCELNESEVATKLLQFDNVYVKYDSSGGTVSELTERINHLASGTAWVLFTMNYALIYSTWCT